MTTHRVHSSDPIRTSLWRSRWAAIGAAVAVSLGAGGLFVAQAAPGTTESTIVAVSPERILDTRDPVNVGLPGPFVSQVSQKLQVTGSIPTATGPKTVVPGGATGVLLNVTSVGSTADGFISIRPGDATGAPTTSSLNVSAGVIVPNSVQVAMPTAGANAGKIDITWDAFGAAGPTTDILIDVVGYTTTTGLQQLVADVAAQQAAIDALEAKVAPLVNSVATFAGGDQSLTLGAEQVVRSVSVMPPANGKVIVTSSGYIRNPGFDALSARCAITTGSAIDFGFLQAITIPPGTNAVVPIAGTRGFDATSGVLLTVNLVCDRGIGASGLIDDSSLTAVFAPG